MVTKYSKKDDDNIKTGSKCDCLLDPYPDYYGCL